MIQIDQGELADRSGAFTFAGLTAVSASSPSPTFFLSLVANRSHSINSPSSAMQSNTVQPNGWVALRLPSDNVRVLQVTPNTFVSRRQHPCYSSD